MPYLHPGNARLEPFCKVLHARLFAQRMSYYDQPPGLIVPRTVTDVLRCFPLAHLADHQHIHPTERLDLPAPAHSADQKSNPFAWQRRRSHHPDALRAKAALHKHGKL